MDLTAAATRYRQAAAAVQSAGPRIVELQAQTGRVLAQQRVQETGVQNAAYSQNFIPTFLFKGRELNAGGRAYLKKNPLGNWGGFRAAQGLPVSYVNLTYTGRTFQSLQTRAGVSGDNVFRAETVASDSESAKVMAYNIKRYGDFMAPTPQERGQLNLLADREVAAVLRQYL